MNSIYFPFILYLTAFTSLYALFRVSFILFYSPSIDVNLYFYIPIVFLQGLRFDFSVIFLFLIPFIVLSFGFYFNRFTFYRGVWKYGPLIPFALCFVILVTDFIYFQNAQKHMGYEAIVFLGKDAILLLHSAIIGQTYLVVSGIFILGFILIFLFLILRKWNYPKDLNLRSRIIYSVFFVIISLLGIRGGTQKSFISPSNAIVTEDPLMNQFVLNGVFTVVQELVSEKFSKIQEMGLPESITIVRKIIEYTGTNYVNDLYPIYRKVTYPENKAKKDILIILLESWPAKYVSREFNGKIITPNFNDLMNEGNYFPKFFANGGRTSNGLVSVLSGFPDRPGKSMVHSKYSLNKFTPLAELLGEKGYRTYFYYGGELAFENLTPIIRNWGFQNISDASTLSGSGKIKKTVWGYYDEVLFENILNDIKNDSNSSPTLRICLTLSTHHPFEIPDSYPLLFPPDEEENRFINSMNYADSSLGKFISEFKKLDKYKNTTILLLSDHTSHRTLNYFEDRNIPFLILNHGNMGKVNFRVSSQIDVLPTVLGMVGGEFYFSGMGRDIFHDDGSGYAYVAFGNIYGWAEKNILFMDTVEEFNGLHFTISEPYESKGTCKDNHPACVEAHLKAKAFLNLSEELLKKNLIAPPASFHGNR